LLSPVAQALIVVSAKVNDLRNPQVRIFLSYIFLLAKPKQENVGEENKSGRFLKSSADGRNDDQSRKTRGDYAILPLPIVTLAPSCRSKRLPSTLLLGDKTGTRLALFSCAGSDRRFRGQARGKGKMQGRNMMSLVFLPGAPLFGARDDDQSRCASPPERLLPRILKGIDMPSYKFAVTLCMLLLLTLVLHESVSAQSEGSKFEVGAQFSVIGRRASDDATSIGGGGRVTFNLTRYLALEGELNYFPSAGFNDVRRFQGQFGVKSGLRLNRFGVFGKVRPGFIDTKSRFRTFSCLPGTVFAPVCNPVEFSDADTKFSLDVGGVVEFYPARRITVRFDVGDTIVNRQEPVIFINRSIFNSQAPPILVSSGFFAVAGSDAATHNLQLSAGVGFRF
jgi:hypothetical protein